jgi:WD40-like Beta Propeller Repeat
MAWLGRTGVVCLAASAFACDPVPAWRLGDGVFAACTDASDLACTPFAAPLPVAEVASPGDDDEKPTLTADMLEMYFLSDRTGGPGQGDVWQSVRASPSDPWGAPTLVTAINDTSRETSPAVSADGLTLYVASDRAGGLGGLDIWMSTRASRGGDWSAAVPVVALNSAADEIPRPPGYHALVMPLSRRPTSNDPYQLFSSSRPVASAPWSSPVQETSLDSGHVDDDGYLMDDGLTLYFSSDRLNGSQDLFVTERPGPSAPFARPVPLATLNTASYADRDPWVSPDGREMYFTSDRSGSLQIYYTTR